MRARVALLAGLAAGALITPLAHLVTTTILGRSWINPKETR